MVIINAVHVVCSGLLQSFRVGEDVPIESEMVTQALDKVQTQVEHSFREARQQVRINCFFISMMR